MSRMCRFAEAGERGYEALWPGSELQVVAESYSSSRWTGRRVRTAPSAPRSPWWTARTSARGRHEALHAQRPARLRGLPRVREGTRRFPRPGRRAAEALRVMKEELVPAILFHHHRAARAVLEDYGAALLERFSNPWFNDTIERGVRGAAEKLAPRRTPARRPGLYQGSGHRAARLRNDHRGRAAHREAPGALTPEGLPAYRKMSIHWNTVRCARVRRPPDPWS